MRERSIPKQTTPQTQKAGRFRIEFTDAQRAMIFVRDRATCCFSGANLWLLDAPLIPGYQRDWVDHIVPSARGGQTAADNGVCASHPFNAKKRANGADNLYLFRNGIPTFTYYEIFGLLPQAQVERLKRLEKLTEADWYFNRAIGQILLGFDYRCWRKYSGNQPSRDDLYWFGSALKKMKQFQKVPTVFLEDRGIVPNLNQETETWLKLRSVKNIEDLTEIADALFPIYWKNFKVWNDYYNAIANKAEATQVLHQTTQTSSISETVLSTLQQDFEIRFSSASSGS